MKAIYTSLSARLQAEVPEIKWIDEDNGQLSSATRPAVAFPCCLIDISYPKCTSITDADQHVYPAIALHLAWDVRADTSGNAPATTRAAGLSPYDLIDKVHRCMQGWAPDGCDPLDRKSQKKTTTRAAFAYAINYETVCED